MPTNSMRAFISIAPDPLFVPALASIQAELRASTGGSPIRWTQPDQIHLTLSFLGNITPDQSNQVVHRLPKACNLFTPFTLRLSGLGYFPGHKRPRVIWIGLQGAVETLLALQSSIGGALSDLGLHQEPQPFHPHLTLGRLRPGHHRLNPQRLFDYTPPDLPPWRVQEILLMRSELSSDGAHHSLIFSHDLAATTTAPGSFRPKTPPPSRTATPSAPAG